MALIYRFYFDDNGAILACRIGMGFEPKRTSRDFRIDSGFPRSGRFIAVAMDFAMVDGDGLVMSNSIDWNAA